MKFTDKALQNAHKFAYLIQQYPEHTMDQIIALFQLPSIDINCAIWAALDDGLIGEPDKETKKTTLLEVPLVWAFGPEERDLETDIVYAFRNLAKKEIDLEENYLGQWTQGYSAQDTLIAVQRLLETDVLAKYAIEDGEEGTYVFFTLTENRDKQWGRKQFKKDPLGKKKK